MTRTSISRRSLLAGAAVTVGALPLVRPAAAQGAAAPLSWWYEGASPAQQALLDEVLVQPFNSAQSAAKLAVEFRGSALSDQLMIALAANEGPDIVMTNGPSWTNRLVDNGKLAPLDTYAQKYGWNEKLPKFMIDLGTRNGSFYALPKTVESQVLFYNKTVFDKQGHQPPRDLKAFEAIADDLLAKGITPIAAGNAGSRFTNRHYVSIVWNAYTGPDAIQKALAGEMAWNAPRFVEAIELLKSWWDKGYFGGQTYFSMNAEQAFTLMSTGRSAMALQGTWALQWVPESFAKSGQELDWVPIPQLHADADYPVYPLGIGAHLAVNNASRNKDAAAEVLNMLTEPQVIEKLAASWAGEWDVPILAKLPAATDQYGVLAQRVREAIAEATAANTYGYTPWSFWPPRTDDYMKGGIEEVWLGQVTPQAFCDNVAKIFQEEFEAGAVAIPPARE